MLHAIATKEFGMLLKNFNHQKMNLTFEITRKIKEFGARKCTSEKGFDTDGDDDLYHFHYDNHDDHVADDDDTDH